MPAPDVTAFIADTFRSVWALELLCLLRKEGGRALPHEDMVRGLRGSDLVVQQSLAGLTASGLVLTEADGSARFAPASQDLEHLAQEAEALYRKSPDAVRRMIVAAANPGLSAFADAFRLRKD